MSLKTITLDGIKLHYEEKGSGFPVIFLHGWGGSLESFKLLKEYFIKNYRVFILDLPGFGKSGKPFETWNVSKYKDFVMDFAEVHNLKKFALVGHSFGGRISIKIAKENSDAVEAIVLCASAGIKPKRTIKGKIFYGVAKVGKGFFKLPIVNKGTRLAKKVLYKMARTKDYLNVSGVMKETFKKVVEEDLRPLLKKIKVPTLIAWGRDDKTTPLSDAEIMKEEIKSSELKIIEGARHGVHFQQPKILGEAILEFFKKNGVK